MGKMNVDFSVWNMAVNYSGFFKEPTYKTKDSL